VRAVADLTTGVVRATIDIDAPPDVVFAALVEPEQLAAWWGGGEYRTFDWKLDLRPGGQWSVQTHGAGGAGSVRGEYLEVDPPRRLVYTWLPSWEDFQRSVITLEVRATETGSRVTVVHEGFVGRPEACEGHAMGWDKVLGWLGGFVAAR
jgi:uncharacterized protein YndB with AHSA1/START domain